MQSATGLTGQLRTELRKASKQIIPKTIEKAANLFSFESVDKDSVLPFENS